MPNAFLNLLAGPLTLSLPMIGEIATTYVSFKASFTPSKDNIGEIEVIGFEGPIITASEFLMMSIIPSVGFTLENLTSKTSGSDWYLIKKSWNSNYPISVIILISEFSSLIGIILQVNPMFSAWISQAFAKPYFSIS